MPYSFSSKDRICKKKTFQKIYKEGFFLNGPYACFYYFFSDAKISRLGLTVSRKVGNSVVCSRIKRYYREFFRTSPLRQELPHIDLVISVRSLASLNTRIHLLKDFELKFQKIKKKRI